MRRFEALESRLALNGVPGWSLEPSTTDPGQTDLVFQGTPWLDAVFFLPAAGDNNVLLIVPVYGAAQPAQQVEVISGVTGKIIMHAGAGTDIVAAELLDDVPIEIHGGAGDDILFGTRSGDLIYGDDGVDMIVGGSQASDGNDTLFGGAGEDILVGWHGDDQLDGGADDDVLISGTLDVPNVVDTISAIKFAWIGNGTYAQRTALLEGLVTYVSDGGQVGVQAANPLATGLAGAWAMRGDAEDLTGNGHDGQPINDPIFTLDPDQGGVLEIDPNASPEHYVSVPDDATFDRQENWSVSLLVKLDDDYTTAPRTLTANRSSQSPDAGGWLITYGINGAANHNRLHVTEFEGQSDEAVRLNTETALSPFPADQWTMITAVFEDGGALEGGTTSIYVNGVYNVERERNGPFLSSFDLAIGARPNDPGKTWDGQIGLVYFHEDRALSAAEAAQLASDPHQLLHPQDVLFGGDGQDWYVADETVDQLIDVANDETVAAAE